MPASNVFGIDFQRTSTTISLREGNGPFAKSRSVGDGVRQTIPNIVWNNELSASAAAMKPESEIVEPAIDRGETVWLDEGADVFWKYLYGRLFSYLGRLSPTRRNGYDVVVATLAATFVQTRSSATALIGKSGFEGVRLISPTEALTCRWLGEQKAVEGETSVTAVSVGDTSVVAASYTVDQRSSSRPVVREGGGPAFIHNSGSAFWTRKWAEVVESRFRDDFSALMPAGRKWLMTDAAARFAARVFRAGPTDAIAWTDLFEDLMHEPLYIRRSDLPRLLGSDEMPLKLRDLVKQVTVNNRPDVLLVGGPGAHWAFPVDALTGCAARVWHSADPALDLSIGAAWWPEFEERFQRSLPAGDLGVTGSGRLEEKDLPNKSDIIDYPLDKTEGVEDDELDTDENELPPWERGA